MRIGIVVLIMALGVVAGIFLRKWTLRSNQNRIQSLREDFKKELNKKK